MARWRRLRCPRAFGGCAPEASGAPEYIKRNLGVGFNKSAKLVEQLEEAGVASTANHVGKREVLAPER
jgi:S-DNA-T family DNA segregation ATPase FtsK/SpoIIIE